MTHRYDATYTLRALRQRENPAVTRWLTDYTVALECRALRAESLGEAHTAVKAATEVREYLKSGELP